jgi:general secretion pathway protein A
MCQLYSGEITMYQDFYNFSAEPFRLSPEQGFAYSHKGFAKARAYMDYAFMRAEGFVMITGRPGTGKTTLIESLVNDLSNTSVCVANLVCTQLQADDLLKVVAYEFGIPMSVVAKGEVLQRLTRLLKILNREGRRALLIVDEAQDLSVSAMEELRLLTNIQTQSRPLLQIFLLGQPELRELILSPQLEQVHQRIIAATNLQSLEQDETEAYIRHRLDVVRWRGDPAISNAVFPLVYKFSEGIPRRINLICSRLLLHCAVEERHQVTVADVRDVVQELQSENLASGDSFEESDFRVEDVFEEPIPVSDEQAQPALQQVDDRHRMAEPVMQRGAAYGVAQLAPAPESRYRSAQNSAPRTDNTRTSRADLREVKKDGPARLAVSTERTSGRVADSRSRRQRKESRLSRLTPILLGIGGSIAILLLFAFVVILFSSRI